ncbi:MAG: PilC/PilY family type IV pilus protein, partial [Burkholderiaceae bacterium]
ARGNYSLWNAQERWQCVWGTQSNNNDPSDSGLMAYPDAPSQSSQGLDVAGKGSTTGKGDYFVRIEVCKSGKLGTERCKQYPSGNYKPVGVLQSFGETDRIRFGLMTGSYKRNLSGGVLRKNISRLADEIDIDGTGRFIDLPAAGVPASPAPGDPALTIAGGSIIRTLSLLRIVGYRYTDGTYFGGSNDDNCPYQRALDTNGECKSWGNPMSEMYYEGLRYFAGQTAPTAAFQGDDSSLIAKLATATWPSNRNTVLSTKNYCAPLSVLVVNGAVSTNENDNQIGSVTFMENAASATAKSLANGIGAAWGITGSYYFGHADGAGSGSTGYDICSGKSLTGLGEAIGICPEGPTLNGSYLMAGLAYHAHTNKVRTDITVPPSAARLKRTPLRIDTYGVSIAGGIPRIPVKFKGETQSRVVIQPAYRLTQGTYGGGGALVDARIIRQIEENDRSYGTIMVSWEDSEAGGDYDMDVWGIITYEMKRSTNRITVTTDTVYKASANPQGFGYVISGTSQDGLHFHSGVYGFDYTDPTPPVSVTGSTGRLNASGGCVDCEDSDEPSTATYSLSTTPPAKALEDPLYYASLFGGFQDTNSDRMPNQSSVVGGVIQPSEYDKRDNATGVDTPDGIPDTYFRVDNPLGLEMGLERTFQLISEQSSLASLQASATRIVAGTSVYQATFNSGDWSGSLDALPIDSNGRIGVARWNAASASLASGSVDPATRQILSMNSSTRAPIAFQYAALSTQQQAALNALPGAATDGRALLRLQYLRGDQALEGVGVSQFRRRVATVLGDIVNSGPVYVGRAEGGLADASYLSYITSTASRTPMVYVGANDGMVHGFSAVDGSEVFAYVPSPVYPKLSALTAQDYAHQYTVDGQMSDQDVQVGGAWRTYLVGGLGGGGQGVFALDVTNPAAASEAAPGNVVKWEFTDRDDSAMGYLYTSPIVRRLENGQWVAMFSSGYNAEFDDGARPGNGRAAIFVLKLSGPTGSSRTWIQGTDYWRITLPVGATTAPNGIGGVSSFDSDGNGAADLLYAGDLTGRVWRVRLPQATGTWTPTAQAIFQAVDSASTAQAITAPLALSVGPNYTGAFITFGTGKLLEPTDLKPVSGVFPANSMYGIWDKTPATDLATALTRADLMGQRILATESNSAYAGGSAENGAIEFSLMSAYVPNYGATSRSNTISGTTNPLATGPTATTTANQRGWYFDVPSGSATGERSIYRPETVGSFSIFVNALPSADACEGGGSEAQYAVETLTGGRSNFGGFDRDANGKIQGSNGSLLGDQSTFGDVASVSGVPQKFYSSRRESTGGFGQMTIMKTGATVGSSGGAGSSCDGAGLAPIGVQSFSSGLIGSQRLPGGCIGRVQWRELVTH